MVKVRPFHLDRQALRNKCGSSATQINHPCCATQGTQNQHATNTMELIMPALYSNFIHISAVQTSGSAVGLVAQQPFVVPSVWLWSGRIGKSPLQVHITPWRGHWPRPIA
eukprot:4386839-Amphidinium_carterae.1